MRAEPAAVAAISPSLAGGQRELLAARITRVASRLGYELLGIVDTDTTPDLATVVRRLDADAVITPERSHLRLAAIARLCEVITLTPEAMHYRDGHYELLAHGNGQSTASG